jgi:hypothetical protein
MRCTRALASIFLLLLAAGCGRPGALPSGADGPPGAATPDAALAGGDAATQTGPADAVAPSSDLPAPSDVPPIINMACANQPLGPAPLRRLTNAQYLRTLRDLTGFSPTTPLPFESQEDGFEDRAAIQTGSELLVETWSNVADEVVAALEPRMDAVTGCPMGLATDACARSFITSFGLRAHRRPLTGAETDAYFTLFSQVRALGAGADALATVLRAMLQSPHLLYRPEVRGSGSAGGRLTLDGFEVASRLAYFLWGTMPDQTLLEAASAGKLGSAGDISAQARRMLGDLRARPGLNDFFRQWFGVDRVLDRMKDSQSFPSWNPTLAAAMREEGYRFFQHVVFDRDGKLSTLLTSKEVIVNAPLAALYGLPITGTGWQPVDASASHRLGFLTQGWFLAGRAGVLDSNPVLRGLFVRQTLLCQEVPPPPANIPPPEPPKPGLTARERYVAHISNPACAGCHSLIDPLGFPFESYDAIGAFRTTESGKPIDTSGELRGTRDSDGAVTDAPDLIRRLAGSAEVRGCAARRWYELSLGRRKEEVDACMLGELERGLAASGGNLQDLMVAITTSLPFRTRPSAEVAAATTTTPLITDPKISLSAKKMILDLLANQVSELRQRHLLPRDRQTMDGHLQGLRALEQKLAMMP